MRLKSELTAHDDDDRGAKDPSAAEIRTMCLAIQERWSEAERRKRAAWVIEAEHVELTTASVDGVELVSLPPAAKDDGRSSLAKQTKRKHLPGRVCRQASPAACDP
ncbi:hypothetical protein OAS39_00560 [Pirellulales bacterium]|nr:hypothetical protein [Pirellulales bacterium]